MALTINQLTAVTQDFYLSKLVDQIFESNTIWQRGRNKFYQAVGGGTDIKVPVAYAKTTATGWFDGLETLNTTDNDQFTAATFDWKHIYGNITISDSDEIKNNGDAEVIDFVGSKVQITQKTVADDLGTAMFNDGTAPKEIVGLRAAIDSTTNTYGGIDRTTNSWWQPQRDTTTLILSIPAMTSMYGDARVDNDKPTLILTTQDQWDNYHSLLQPQERFQKETDANGGFNTLQFMSTPIKEDSHCPAGDMYFLNENYLMIKYHPQKNFAFDAFRRNENQAGSFAKIFWSGAFCVSNPRMQGVITNLT